VKALMPLVAMIIAAIVIGMVGAYGLGGGDIPRDPGDCDYPAMCN
jgi:hypothetical protein